MAQISSSTQSFTYTPPEFSFLDFAQPNTQAKTQGKKASQSKIAQSNNKSKLDIEIDSYTNESCKNVDPIDYWRVNKKSYQGLFYCFEYIFSMMASSVPSESLFSEAGDQVTDKINRLDPCKVNKMMVVEDHYKYMGLV